jgi:putative ABC transport system permease protein
MHSLIAANIKSRPTRAAISIIAVAIGVILTLIIGGIVSGTLNDYVNRTMRIGAELIVQEGGASIFYAVSGATLPIKLAERLRQEPGVVSVAPVLSKFTAAESNFGLVFGIDLASYRKFPGRLQIIKGRESLEGNEIIVDELYAASHKVEPGMTLNLLDHQWKISGICRAGAVVRIFVPLEIMQQLNGTPDKATIMFVKLETNSDAGAVLKSLRENYPGLNISDPATLREQSSMPGFTELQFTVAFISALIGFMVILMAMYSTIYERTREIGILKSLGASRSFIISMILKESVIICTLGVLLGIGVSVLIRALIVSSIPTLQVEMGPEELIKGVILGLLGGTLGALYPAYKAARMDPVKALSYE